MVLPPLKSYHKEHLDKFTQRLAVKAVCLVGLASLCFVSELQYMSKC